MNEAAPRVVLDACALVDMVLPTRHGEWVAESIAGRLLVAPGHMRAEALNGVGRAWRRAPTASELFHSAARLVAELPVDVIEVGPLVLGAWARRDEHSLADALYVELAARLDTVVITTDRRLARATPLAVAPPKD